METRDGDLVARAQAGDHQAYGALVEQHSRRVFHLAYRITGNEQDAEDVVQDTFMKAHGRLDRYESRAGFGSWLFRIATNCALDLLRARKRRVQQTEPAGAEEPLDIETLAVSGPAQERALYGSEIQHKVALAMRRLTPSERAAFVLRHFEERPIKEVAAMMQQTDNATKQAIFRAVRKLRSALAPDVAFTAVRSR
jgi:RNA polymerase sigma-70 factor (ECF subfamily)